MLVLDLTSGVSGAYAGKLLADLGARVVLVETEDGSPLRHRPPFDDASAHGAAFAHLAGGKQSVQPGGGGEAAALLRALMVRTDILLTDGTSPYEEIIPPVRPAHVVEVVFSPFGRSGPYAGWRGSDIATWAMAGYMYFTGEGSREPLFLPGSQSELHAGVHGAFASLVGLFERRRSGAGQRVEVSLLESVLAAHAWLVSSWVAAGELLARSRHDLVRCKDGWAYFMRIAPNPNLFVLIERAELADEPIGELASWLANVPRIFELVAEWAMGHTVAEIVERAQELRVAVTPVLDASDIALDAQMKARDWWEPSEDPALGPLLFPGQPYKLSATSSARRGPAPLLGEHTAEHASLLARETDNTSPRAVPASMAAPLSGLKVIEVTSNWAGPVCGRHLADLGADVIKVEWATRPATRALYWPGQPQDLQRQPWNRSLYFNEMNRNKRDVVIDLSAPAGRDVFLKLVQQADVLIENNSARVMPNLGLDYAALRKVNRSLVMASMSGYGASGPRRDWSAYGSNIETTCGLTSVTGYRDGSIYRTTLFYADPVAGIHGAVALLAALEHRRRTGEGQWIDISLNECGAAFCWEMLMDYRVTGNVPLPAGNRDRRFAPQGAYKCAGIDNWVAICVQSDDEWPLLARAIGRVDMAEDQSLRVLAGRQGRHDEIDAAIESWTRGREQYEIAWELQRLGISSAPVLANWQVLPDPHLRGFYVDIDHPVVGVYPYTSWPWRFSRTPASVTRPAPLFAQHNREVLAEAGLDEKAVDMLYADGVTSDEPRFA